MLEACLACLRPQFHNKKRGNTSSEASIMLEQIRNELEIDTNLDGYRKPLRAMGCGIHI